MPNCHLKLSNGELAPHHERGDLVSQAASSNASCGEKKVFTFGAWKIKE